MAELQPIIVFHGRYFARHLGICNPICATLLQLMSFVITHNSMKKEVSILINCWVTANYSVSRPPFCLPSWHYNRICVKLLQLMSLRTNQWKKTSLYINKWLSYSQLYCFTRHFVRHLGICNPICVKLLHFTFGVIPCNVKKRHLYLKPFTWGQ